jgi:TfoX/Sxy family transcriptional regulator of competence genes
MLRRRRNKNEMAYNEALAERIELILEEKKVDFLPKKMFGGMCYMVDEKMCLGIVKEELMARVGEEQYEKALGETGAKLMNFTGRAMKGYVFVDVDGYDLEDDLEKWVQMCLDFNPLAKASKKKAKKRNNG